MLLCLYLYKIYREIIHTCHFWSHYIRKLNLKLEVINDKNNLGIDDRGHSSYHSFHNSQKVPFMSRVLVLFCFFELREREGASEQG